MKKVLFLSPFFYPEKISTGKYNTFLVDKLVKKKFEVDVVAFHPFYPDWVVEEANDIYENVNLYRYGKGVRFPRSQVARRIVLELQYSYFVVKHLLKFRKKYDIAISIFPPVLYMLITAWSLKGTLKVGIIHDIQGIMAVTEESITRRFAASIMGIIERLVYNNCSRLICLSHSMRDLVITKFGQSEVKCQVFYPFVSVKNESLESGSGKLDSLFENGFKHIVYSGALGEKQKPYELFELFCEITKLYSDVKCHIFSRGPTFDKLVSRAKKLGVSNVLFHDLVAEEDLVTLFNKSTIQVIPQAPGTGAGAFPSKLPNLLAHGVPVLAICDQDSELDILIRRVKHARAVNSWDNRILVDEIRCFVDKVDRVPHEEVLAENNKNILKEFDVDIFISSLN